MHHQTALRFAFLFPFLILLLATGGGAHAASVAPAAGEHGMVVSAHHLATRVGVEARRGGNAVDAAVAVAYALAVVHPTAGNLGGGGFMTLQLADGRKSFIDFREKAPLAATRDMFLGPDGNVVPGRSTNTHLAVAVPGTVAGMELALARYGTMKRATLIAPAILYAEQGFVLQQGDIDALSWANEDLARDAPAAAIFLDHGVPLHVGSRLVESDLAGTLRHVRDEGARGFYAGPVAAALVASSHAGGGLITQADLDAYEARERPPVECDYRGFHVLSAPPPSSGGVILCEMLEVLEGYPLGALGFHSAQSVHYEVEAMRHAYVDRNYFLGDPDFITNPLERLLSAAHVQALRAAINPVRAGDSSAIMAGVAPHEGTNTTHYSVIDKEGNAVSVTYTLNNRFGTRLVAAGTGVLLNDEMDDFTARPGAPNRDGLVQFAANAIAPGKRPLSSMTPTIISRDGVPVLVVGTPGGSHIITSVLQVILNVIDYGMNIQEAVDAPRLHQQWQPETTQVEPFALSPDTQRILQQMGHKLVPQPLQNQIAAILVGAPALGVPPVGTNRYYGAIDPRRAGGLALGY